MDAVDFDDIARSLTDSSTRRGVLTRLAGVAFAAVAIQLPGVAEAKKKKRKKPSVNEFGCLNVGQACGGNDGKCCSGICQGNKPKKGKKDKSKCVAHNALDCEAGADSCNADPILCGTNGNCLQTTGQASFCHAGGAFVDCQKDTDCEPDFGPGAACIACIGLTACAVPAV